MGDSVALTLHRYTIPGLRQHHWSWGGTENPLVSVETIRMPGAGPSGVNQNSIWPTRESPRQRKAGVVVASIAPSAGSISSGGRIGDVFANARNPALANTSTAQESPNNSRVSREGLFI